MSSYPQHVMDRYGSVARRVDGTENQYTYDERTYFKLQTINNLYGPLSTVTRGDMVVIERYGKGSPVTIDVDGVQLDGTILEDDGSDDIRVEFSIPREWIQ